MANPFLDQYVKHQVYLQRFGSYNANEFDSFLKQADKVIRSTLSGGEVIATKAQLNNIIKALDSQLSPVYAKYSEWLLGSLGDLTESEVAWNVKSLSNGVTADVTTPSDALVKTDVLIKPVTFQGFASTMPNIMKNFTAAETQRVNSAVISGFYDGQTTSEIATVIRGTKANNFKDGLLNTTRNNARTIARTLTNNAATQTRQATLTANERLLDGVEWMSTLDNRVSKICFFRDGNIYPVDKGPRPPAHPNCRSGILPKVKKEFSLFSGNETRASVGASGGEPVTNQRASTWLKTQPAEFQDEVLGKTRGLIFRNGGLSPTEFAKEMTNFYDQPLTLEEFKKKEPEVWKKAIIE